MKAIVYDIHPVGWATCKWLHHLWPGCRTSRLNGLAMRDIDPPALPGDDWVRVKTRMAGICGTDTAIVQQKQPPDSLLQAYSSRPMVLGHENVAEVCDLGPAVDDSWRGRRVLVEPTLHCPARGTQPPCPRCEAGEFGACENFSGDFGGEYQLPAGTSIGYNAATGGSWGEYFVAHHSQLIPLDDGLSDEDAVLIDPLACCLHAVLRADLNQAERVLVYGGGMMGLGIAGCLRAVGFPGTVALLARSRRLADLAERFGVDELLVAPRHGAARHEYIAARTGATLQTARFGNRLLSGGYDLLFECVGSRQSVNEALKWTRARGQVVLVGTFQSGTLDLTPAWFRELHILGAYGRQLEHYHGRRINTYSLTQELILQRRLPTEGLLSHTFGLQEYRRALAVATNKARHGAMKVAFDLRTD